MIVSWPISRGVKDVVAIRPKPFDTGELGKPPIRTPTCQDRDELDGLGNHRAWHRSRTPSRSLTAFTCGRTWVTRWSRPSSPADLSCENPLPNPVVRNPAARSPPARSR